MIRISETFVNGIWIGNFEKLENFQGDHIDQGGRDSNPRGCIPGPQILQAGGGCRAAGGPGRPWQVAKPGVVRRLGEDMPHGSCRAPWLGKVEEVPAGRSRPDPGRVYPRQKNILGSFTLI